MAKIGILVFVLSLIAACDGDNMHQKIFDNTYINHIGGAPRPIIPAAVAATEPTGLGPELKIMQYPATGELGQQNDPQVLTINIFVDSALPPTATGVPVVPDAFGGPIVGIVKWGSGFGPLSVVEFDVPVRQIPTGNIADFFPRGGAVITIPAVNFEIYARNDANLIAQITFPNEAPIGRNFGPVPVGCNVAIGSYGGNAQPLRSVFLINGDPVLGTGGLPPANFIEGRIPPYAQAVRVLRSDAVEPISVEFFRGGVQHDGPYNIAANVSSPVFDLGGFETTIRVTNLGAANIERIIALYEIGL